MKVHINLSEEYTEPQITILAAEANDDIQKLLSYIQNMEKIIAANEGDSIIILKPEEIYMICSMGRGVKIYSENKEYTSSFPFFSQYKLNSACMQKVVSLKTS